MAEATLKILIRRMIIFIVALVFEEQCSVSFLESTFEYWITFPDIGNWQNN